MPSAQETERQAIIELIVRETNAFLSRDFEGWADCLLKDEGQIRLGTLMGGVMDFISGWETHAERIRRTFADHPTPNPELASLYRRENWSVRIGADMAWVYFDQIGPRSDDPLVTAGLSHQVRILEKHDGRWKIAMLGHGDSKLEYLDYPAVRIDAAQNILWMSEQAKSALPSHPALMKSGAKLLCRYKHDSNTLAAAIKALAELTVVDYRPSLATRHPSSTRPVLLGGETDEGMHVVWVSVLDGMLLVNFADQHSSERHMEEASKLFGLSAAQSRLAALILEGLDIPTAAERLGISPNTAKTHLQRLFDKTGVRSQPALVAKLLGTSPPN